MIAGWLLYCIAASALLAASAAAIDSMLTARGRPARWVWVAAIAGSLVLPTASYVLQETAPRPAIRSIESDFSGLFSRFPLTKHDPWRSAAPIRAVAAARPRAPELLSADRLAVDLAIICIVLASLRVAFDSVLLFRSRRRWTAQVVDDVSVLVSDDIGPAIVGLLEPRIVLPRWTLALAHDERALMLRHEQEHLRTHDGRLTTGLLFAVLAMPWNPAMWYALRRLRTAIEVDCDRRVLRALPDVRRYGALLVDVARRAVGSSLAIAGFSERAAPLARRIQAMTASVGRRPPLLEIGSGVVGATALIGSIALLPPEAPARPVLDLPSMSQVRVSAKYVGDSIAQGDPPVVIAGARDLPPMFSVAEMGTTPRPGSATNCPRRLRDDRDGTVLQVSISMSGVAGVTQRGDTVWTHVRALGYYMVRPEGTYGVGREQLLRVGCGSSTEIAVAGKAIQSDAVATLDSRDDDRPRRIAAEIVSLIHVEPLAVDLFKGRLEIFVGDTTAIDPSGDNFVDSVFRRSRDVMGRAAMPETLSIAMRRKRDQWITMYYYTSMAKN
jgi:hypothetical protein